MTENNPHACGDHGCVLLVPSIPHGMGTNAGCRCLPLRDPLDRETRQRVIRGIRWLTTRIADREAAP